MMVDRFICWALTLVILDQRGGNAWGTDIKQEIKNMATPGTLMVVINKMVPSGKLT